MKHVRFFVLGDPLMDWLMKSYPQSPGLTPEQEPFNVNLSSARTTEEIAFGRLKSRWRVLLKRSDFHFTFSPCMIATCCALHNFSEREKEQVPQCWLEEATAMERALPHPHSAPQIHTPSADADVMRDALSAYMAANFPLRRSIH